MFTGGVSAVSLPASQFGRHFDRSRLDPSNSSANLSSQPPAVPAGPTGWGTDDAGGGGGVVVMGGVVVVVVVVALGAVVVVVVGRGAVVVGRGTVVVVRGRWRWRLDSVGVRAAVSGAASGAGTHEASTATPASTTAERRIERVRKWFWEFRTRDASASAVAELERLSTLPPNRRLPQRCQWRP